MRVYKTGVCSKLIYGSETWTLTSKVCSMLNGANSLMVSRITGRSPHVEASKKTKTLDVISLIRTRRLQWVGHIPRAPGVQNVAPYLWQQGRRRSVNGCAPKSRMGGTHRVGDRQESMEMALVWDQNICKQSHTTSWRRQCSYHYHSHPCSHVLTSTDVTSGSNPTTPSIENSTTTTSPTANASRYRRRDAHEAFFRSRSKTSRHQVRMRRQKAKPRVLTDKERTQWAREHYELHHEMSVISGYHRHISDDDETTTFTDHTTPLTPTSIESMFKYHDDMCIHHDNLRNLTIRMNE